MTQDNDIVALSRFRAALARARVTRRADAILAEPDADRLIPTLPVQDLYLAIKDVGLHDAEELVVRASPEQVQGFLDLDGWEGYELSIERVRPWLEVLVADGPEKIAQMVEALDPEEIALYVQKQAAIYDLSMEGVPDEPEGRFWPTPDSFYVLDIKPGGEEGKAFERFIDHLYRADLSLARRVIMSAKWELGADLEEWAYRFRQGRMADLGFPEATEAMAIYRPLDLASVRLPAPGEAVADDAGAIEAPGTALPALIAEAMDARTLLSQGLATVTDDDTLERLYGALVTLFNRALAADRVEPADVVAARRVLDDVLAYLGLGLEYLVLRPRNVDEAIELGDDSVGARAGQAIVSLPLERIFRVGYSLTASLGQLAETLYLRGRVRLGERHSLLLDGRNREVLSALRGAGLRGRRPRMARALDTPPASGTRPLRSAADIRVSAAALQSASRVPVFFFDDLGLPLDSVAEAADASPGFGFGTVARTLAARILLGSTAHDLALVALRPPEVGSFLARLRDGALTAEDQARVGATLSERVRARGRTSPPELEAWFAEWFASLGRRVAEVEGLYVTA
jgi:hypothetical protein